MIISPGLLQTLGSYRSEDGILSAYVRVDPRLMYDRRHPLAEFKAAVKRLPPPPGEAKSQRLEAETRRVMRLLESERRLRGRGLAVFANEPLGLWEVISLSVPLPNAVYFEETPQVRLLARTLDEYERYAVVALDKEDARLYIVHMDEIEEAAEVFDEGVPGRHEQGGWAQARFQRHTGFHVHEHLKHVLDRLQAYHAGRPFDRLVLGGSPEAVTEFQKMLPTALQERLVGTFSVNRMDKATEVLARARPVYEAYERSAERRLVDQITDAAEAGGPGVTGLSGTLRALNEGRVHILAVVSGQQFEGAECLKCGLLSERRKACPGCGAAMSALPDVIERAIQRMYDNHGRVDMVQGEAADRLASAGGVGARLRF